MPITAESELDNRCRESMGPVLIVDNEPAIAALFSEFLQEAGYRVETVDNGQEAQHRFTMNRPATVLLDLHMPGMNGVDTFAALRRIDPEVPIIIVTGDDDEDLGRALLHAGAFDYLAKPVRAHHLKVVVGAATGQPWSVAWDTPAFGRPDDATRGLAEIAYAVTALSRRFRAAPHRARVEGLGHEALRAALLRKPDDAISYLRALDTLLATDELSGLAPTDAAALRATLRPLHAGRSPEPQASRATDRTDVDLSGLHVLVVDDAPDVVELISVVLQGSGATVVGAQSADDALEAFHPEQVDVVVSDLALPGRDGFWLIEQLRRRALRRRLVAIAVSGVVRGERDRVLRAGFDDFLQKPVEPDELCRRVAYLVAA